MRRMISALLFAPFALMAQEHAHPVGEKLGTVHFPVSCNAAAVPLFDRAVALLHSFEFGEAIKAFNQVLAADSTCMMADWGVAMSRWSNPMAAGNRTPLQLSAGLEAINSARRISKHSTDRERGYLEATARLFEGADHIAQADRVAAYESAMAELVKANPEDTEAKIFYALSLVGAASPNDKTYAKQNKAASILEPLWRREPNHPGLAHYIIHTFDYPSLATRASAAAREYATIAPSAAHALHMPSHIFTRTGLWKESIDTNLRSIEIADKSGSIAEALHAADYAEYAYLQLGEYARAKELLERLPGWAERFDVNAVTGAAPGSAGVFALAAIPARYALERNAWSEAAQLKPSASSFPWTEAMTYFAKALGAAHTRDLSTAQASIDSLAVLKDRVTAKNEPYWSEQVAIQQLGARAWLAFASGQRDSALVLMREAVRREDATEKSAVTPGPLAPARELLGDMLMQMGRKKEALAEYKKTLEVEPMRRRSREGVQLAQQ